MATQADLRWLLRRLMDRSMLSLVAVASGMVIGCAVPGESLSPPVAPASQGVRLSVPFFPDDSDQCGPVALASILAYWGKPGHPGELQKEVYMPAIRGSLPLDLLTAAQARGLNATSYRGSLNSIIAEIDAGHPLIALLNSGRWMFSQGHFVVITGYDTKRGGVYVHSGMSADLFMPYEQLVAAWNKTDRWTLRLLPANQGRSM